MQQFDEVFAGVGVKLDGRTSSISPDLMKASDRLAAFRAAQYCTICTLIRFYD
jgi:hypothetical protein